MRSLSLQEPLVYTERSKLKVLSQLPARLVLAAPMRERHAKQHYSYAINVLCAKHHSVDAPIAIHTNTIIAR